MNKNILVELAKADNFAAFKQALKTEDLNAYISDYEFTPEQSRNLLEYVILPGSDAKMTPLAVLVLENQKEEKYTPYIQAMLADSKLSLETPIYKVNDDRIYPLHFMLAADTTKDFVNLKALLQRQDFSPDRDAHEILRAQCSPVKAAAVVNHPKMDVNDKKTYMFWGKDNSGYVGKAECPIWMAAGVETALRLCDAQINPGEEKTNTQGAIAMAKFKKMVAQKPADGSLIGCRFEDNRSGDRAYFGFESFLKAVVKSYTHTLGREDIEKDVWGHVMTLTNMFRREGIAQSDFVRGKKTPEYER